MTRGKFFRRSDYTQSAPLWSIHRVFPSSALVLEVLLEGAQTATEAHRLWNAADAVCGSRARR